MNQARAQQSNNGANLTQVAPQRQSSLSRITRGVQDSPIRVVLYGAEGVGKSTYASEAPRPIFLCSEDGTARLNVERLPHPTNWTDVINCVRDLQNEEHPYRTLVIDTLDWLEPLCWREVCRRGNKRSIEDFSYGKGYTAALEIWRDLILLILAMSTKRQMNVIALAHSHVKKVDDPLGQPYDRHCLKLHERAAAIWKESVDAVLFAKVEVTTFVDTDSKRTKGRGNGSRIVLTSPTAGYDAKNRFDLPSTIPLDWSVLEQAAKRRVDRDPEPLRKELLEMRPKLAQDKQAKLDSFLAGNPSTQNLAIMVDRVRTMVFQGEEAQAAAQSNHDTHHGDAPADHEKEYDEPGSRG